MFVTNKILQNLISFLAPVVGIAILLFCLVQAFKIFGGRENGSPKKLICGVLLLFFILGIMYTAGSFDTYGHLFSNLTNDIIDNAASDANNILH